MRAMARKKARKKKKDAPDVPEPSDGRGRWHSDLHQETKKGIFAIAAFVLAAILVLSYIGKGGSAGSGISSSLGWLLGNGYFFAPILCVILGFSFIFSRERAIVAAASIGGASALVSSLALLNIAVGPGTGGFLGSRVSYPLRKMFDFWAGFVIAAGFLIISVLLMFNIPLFPARKDADGAEEPDSAVASAGEDAPDGRSMRESVNMMIKDAMQKKESEAEADAGFPPSLAQKQSVIVAEESLIPLRVSMNKSAYKKPPLDLLQGDRGTPSSGDIRANANVIRRTLENFGIAVEMGEVAVGPTVTQYALRPAEGVKLSKIVALHSNLSLALAAHPIRIEAPIPGKSLVGVEMPNRSVSLVGLRSLLEQKLFRDSASPLLLGLGRDVSGAPVFADLSRMPHLLISGSTGSGKSVAAHAIIASLLYRNGPDMLRFILVDPKRVELSMYNDIPHLLTPVITDAKKTISALRWATKEMDRRYDILSQNQARDIMSFNAMAAKAKDGDPLPYIVIIIDELADLMSVFPREVETSIIRLAQMARAVGIHLIVATQRPSVEVITGLIKANITSRMAFQVASQIDSRTILDGAGAEKLLGNGDMLFLAGDTARPRRIQGAYVSEAEVKRVVEFLREAGESPEFDEGILETKMEDDGAGVGGDMVEGDDPLYDEARAVVVSAGKASASYLQRRLRVGYARAARLLDVMEAHGVIGPADGAKSREVLVKGSDDSGSDDGMM